MMSVEELAEIEQWFDVDEKVSGGARISVEKGRLLLAALREEQEENRRLRQIIADVRRLVQEMEPDNPEVRA